MNRKDLILSFYIPTFLLALGGGLLAPTLPLYLKSFGVSFGLVSLAMSAVRFGMLASDVPAGSFIGWLGHRRAMLIGVITLAVTMVAAGAAHVFVELIVYRLITGVGMALWGVSRHAYITNVTAVGGRGRAIAVFGGVGRIARFAGPAIGGVVAAHYGFRTPFFMHAGLAAIAASLVFLFVARDTAPDRRLPQARLLRQLGFVLRHHYRDLGTAGSAQMFAQMIRAGRHLFIPLYAAYQIGLAPETIGLIMSVSAALDMMMFYPAGIVMDRFGRKYTSVPCFFILALGMGLVPLTQSAFGLLLATGLMGFGNGLGSGAMMTLGADLAPKERMSEFLGLWRLIGDIGGMSGPLAVGALADVIGLSSAALVLAGVGMFAAATLFWFVPETLNREAG